MSQIYFKLIIISLHLGTKLVIHFSDLIITAMTSMAGFLKYHFIIEIICQLVVSYFHVSISVDEVMEKRIFTELFRIWHFNQPPLFCIKPLTDVARKWLYLAASSSWKALQFLQHISCHALAMVYLQQFTCDVNFHSKEIVIASSHRDIVGKPVKFQDQW